MTTTKTIGRATALLMEHGLAATYWGKRIIAAEETGGFAASDNAQSGKWLDCACGKLTAQIARLPSGAPKDKRLYELGDAFAVAVDRDEITDAAVTLVQIEQRAAELVRNPELEQTT